MGELAGRGRIALLTDIDFGQQSFGSHSRILAMVKALSAEAEVDVLMLQKISPAALEAARAAAPTARIIPAEEYAAAASKRRVRREVSARPAFQGTRQEAWIGQVAEHLAQRPATAVIVEYVRLAYLLDGVPPKVLRVLDLHDVMFQRRLSFAQFGRRPSIVMSRADEVALIDCFDVAIAITQEDAALLAPMLRRAILVVVPHMGVAVAAAAAERVPGRILFIGADTQPNRDGLHWFLQQVWPALPPRMTLHVAGDISKFVKRLPGGVTALGRIPDVPEFYAGGEVAINPVFYGGGMKIKTLEAMLHGTPVVTTHEGAKGMAELVGPALRVASGRAAFAGHLLALLGDGEALARARAESRAGVARLFSAERVMGDLLQVLKVARG